VAVKMKNDVYLFVSVAREPALDSQILLSHPSSSISVGHLRAAIPGHQDGAVSNPAFATAVQGILVPPRLMPL
jgi:hypothetical protein